MSDELVIDVHGLVKQFGDKRVVNGIDMQVRRGEIFGFLGPNGSGKTTSIRMICGLLTPDGGQGTCLGYDILSESRQIKRQVGYMTQRFSFYEDLTIRENLDFIARVYGMRRRREAVAQALEQLGLSERRHQLAGALSGGWKQRLALAACLLHEPKLLLLDEPTAGVDPKARRDFWEQIHQLSNQGITVMVTTHYMDEAERCTRLGYIAYGDLLAQGTPSELVAQANLSTWNVTGPELNALAPRLRELPAAQHVVAFGDSLHVSGRDHQRLESELQSFLGDTRYHWSPSQARLEDVFIDLMDKSGAS